MASDTLVTGATGFLGRGLVRGLIRRGERVTAIVRAGGSDEVARARLVRAVGVEFDVPELTAVAGDLEVPESLARAAARGPFGAVWHLAAVLDLGARRADELARVNVGGTAALLLLARITGTRSFHYVGTAYAGGISDGPLPEGPLPASAVHRNEYERSKHLAERLVRRAEAEGLPVTVYRPSIVVGDSRTGRAELHGAFYEIVRLCRLPCRLPEIVLPGRPDTRLDLVPVDRVVGALLALSARDETVGETYNLVSPEAPTVAEVVAVGRRVLGLPITEIRDTPPERLPWPGPALFSAASPILAYLRDGPTFARARAAAALGEDFLAGTGGRTQWLEGLFRVADTDRFGRDEEGWRREMRTFESRLRQSAVRRPVAV